MAFYLLGAITFVVSLAFPGDLFDRYLLAYIPFLIVFVVRTSGEWGRAAWTYSLLALTLLATFTVLAIWQAATWMEQRTGQVRAGWNWTHLGHNDSESYLVDDVIADGFRLERDFPYTCRLCGFTTRDVLAQSRADMPPLPPN
jgi:hypothetical protein